MVVVSSHLPGETAATSRHPVHPVECDGPFDYHRGLAAVWDTDATVVNIEHDVEHADPLIDGLLACRYPACAYPYLIYTHTPEPFYCAAYGTAEHWPGFWATCNWVQPGDEWADFAAPGFIKLDPDVRTPFGPECAWQGVEQTINDAMIGRWHLHWPPVEHYHR